MVIKVPIIVSYNNKGTKQAVKGIGSLEKGFKKMGLASKLSFAAATTAVTAFAKKSVTAALEESKAVAVLNNQLKNLGLAFAATGVSAYIDSLQRATGVSEDQLRPAFSALIRATNDLGKAQQLLALSLDVSATTGRSVESVSASLSKAYLGQYTALARLGVGLSKAELKTLSFEQIQTRLTTLFAGSAQAAVATYAGGMAKLQISAKEASETIGFSLIGALERLSKNKSIGDTATAMENLGNQTAFAITGVASLIESLNKIPGASSFNLGNSPLGIIFNSLANFGKEKTASGLTATNRQSPRGAERAAANSATARKKEIDDKTKILALNKQTDANKKLSGMFDMEAIQIAAALQGKLSDEDRARVKALQALKTEDKNDDVSALADLTAAKRQATLDEIADQKRVVEDSKKSNAEMLADKKNSIIDYNNFVKSFSYAGGLFAGTALANSGSMAVNAASAIGSSIPGFDPSSGGAIFGSDVAGGGGAFMPGDAGYTGTAGQTPNVTVNLNGGINVGSAQEFQDTIQTVLQSLNSAGSSFYTAGMLR